MSLKEASYPKMLLALLTNKQCTGKAIHKVQHITAQAVYSLSYTQAATSILR